MINIDSKDKSHQKKSKIFVPEKSPETKPLCQKGNAVKVYIMVDFEGIAGFIEWDDYAWDTPMGQEKRSRLRKFLTGEVNAAIEGALAAGAKEVLVWDAHGPSNNSNNIYFENLNPEAQVIIGWKGLPSFYPLLNEGYDAGIYIGGHAMAGSAHAIAPHTKTILNDYELGEVGMFIAVCGSLNIPVVFISGDQTTIEQNCKFIPEAGYVITKHAFSPYAAKTLIPKKSQQLIREGVEKSLKRENNISCWNPGPPYTIQKGEQKITGDNLWEMLPEWLSSVKFDNQDIEPQRSMHTEYLKQQMRYNYSI